MLLLTTASLVVGMWLGFANTAESRSPIVELQTKPSVVIVKPRPRPIYGSRTCQAWNDPHYSSFDKTKFDYHGTCKHYLMKPCGRSWPRQYPRFEILGQNYNCGSQLGWLRPACIGSVELRVNGIIINVNRYQQLRVNGAMLMAPVSLLLGAGKTANIVRTNGPSRITIGTNFGLTITHTRNPAGLQIKLNANLAAALIRKTCGICGQHDYVTGDNDFTLANGTNYPRITTLRNHLHFSYAEFYQFTPKTPSNCVEVPYQKAIKKPTPDVVAAAKTKCSIINKANGPFSKCHKDNDRKLLYDFCVADLTISPKFLLDNLAGYAKICAEHGPTGDWRKEAGLSPMRCGQNEVYSTATNPDCVPTCRNRFPCGSINKGPFEEGCVCKPGFVYSGTKCIRFQDCNCSNIIQ